MPSIRFFPIGDSYTIGEGVPASDNWPSQLIRHLRSDGIDAELIANPSRTGWTTQKALDRELPLFEEEKPNLATVLLGVNDWVQGVPEETFRARFTQVLDRMLAVLPSAKRLIVLTIPDFSVTPAGKTFGDPLQNAAGIQRFNQIIREEANRRSLAVVDLFTVSQAMGSDPSLVTDDGLHPSGKEYTAWEALIYPSVMAAIR